ncbi:hypothetical protein M832_06260 [Chlamydia avium 10DC88]|uniref:Uncharacterized protein n=1 Tax=Chlamydia avium 10DC88 TaxID=1229831 RepID=W8JMH1_9CHLA|nr:hypothetical protein M832_06260 [Chlamydia avium 10DC88]
MARSYIKILFSPGPKYSFSYSVLCIFLSILIFIPPLHWFLFPEAYTFFSKKTFLLKISF